MSEDAASVAVAVTVAQSHSQYMRRSLSGRRPNSNAPAVHIAEIKHRVLCGTSTYGSCPRADRFVLQQWYSSTVTVLVWSEGSKGELARACGVRELSGQN
eukprot:3247493-Pyramimonas_sp.AAC.2